MPSAPVAVCHPKEEIYLRVISIGFRDAISPAPSELASHSSDTVTGELQSTRLSFLTIEPAVKSTNPSLKSESGTKSSEIIFSQERLSI